MDEPSHTLEPPPQKEPADVFGMMGAPHYSAALARYPHTLDNLTFKVFVRKKFAQKQLLTFAADMDIPNRPGTLLRGSLPRPSATMQ